MSSVGYDDSKTGTGDLSTYTWSRYCLVFLIVWCCEGTWPSFRDAQGCKQEQFRRQKLHLFWPSFKKLHSITLLHSFGYKKVTSLLRFRGRCRRHFFIGERSRSHCTKPCRWEVILQPYLEKESAVAEFSF